MRSTRVLVSHAMLLALGLGVLSGCTTSIPQSDADSGAVFDGEEVVPKKFQAHLDDMMSTRTAELREGSVYYTTTMLGGGRGTTVKITPTEEQWRAFRAALNEARVRQWRADYGNPAGIEDGLQWGLEVTYGGQAVIAKGDNNFPGDWADTESRGKPGALFRRYLDAIKELLGGRDIR